MAVNIRQDGSFEINYVGPYTGLNVQVPATLIRDTDAAAINDFILHNAEIRSRPVFTPGFIVSPEPNSIIVGLGIFQGFLWALINPSGKFWTFNFTGAVWTNQGTVATAVNNPVNWRVFQNKLYFTNGNGQLSSWDGTTFTASVASAGGNSIGAIFLDEMDNHLIMATTTENAGGIFPQRVRWAATGLPAVWDPTVNVNAGFTDFLEVPDNITGLMMLGRVGYIFRTDGITEMSPTGNGQSPFDFNHMWASQFGIGNLKFYGAAQYGTTGFFIARDNVYMMQALQLQAIGGFARDAILDDIGWGSIGNSLSPFFHLVSNPQQAIGFVAPYIKSTIIPDGTQFVGQIARSSPISTNQSGSYPNLMYMLFVPKITNFGDGTQTSLTNVWVYHVEDQNWTEFILPNFAVTARPTLGYTTNPGDNVPSGPIILVPCRNLSNSTSSIGIFDTSSFNDTAQGSNYSYKIEDIVTDRVPTIRRVILTYRDIGAATLTITITGTDDNGALQSVTSPPITIGNLSPNALLTKFIDIEFTGFRPQLSISRAANGGPLSIVRVSMIGQIEKEVTL